VLREGGNRHVTTGTEWVADTCVCRVPCGRTIGGGAAFLVRSLLEKRQNYGGANRALCVVRQLHLDLDRRRIVLALGWPRLQAHNNVQRRRRLEGPCDPFADGHALPCIIQEQQARQQNIPLLGCTVTRPFVLHSVRKFKLMACGL
jgi:hypothetical protein